MPQQRLRIAATLAVFLPSLGFAAPLPVQVSAFEGEVVQVIGTAHSGILSGKSVAAGTEIRTGADGRAELTLHGDPTLAIGGGVQLLLHSMDQRVLRLRMASGALRIDTRAPKGGKSRDVRINVGDLRVRVANADAWVELGERGGQLCLISGVVEAQQPNGAARLDTPGQCLRQSGLTAQWSMVPIAVLQERAALLGVRKTTTAVAAAEAAPAPTREPVPQVVVITPEPKTSSVPEPSPTAVAAPAPTLEQAPKQAAQVTIAAPAPVVPVDVPPPPAPSVVAVPSPPPTPVLDQAPKAAEPLTVAKLAPAELIEIPPPPAPPVVAAVPPPAPVFAQAPQSAEPITVAKIAPLEPVEIPPPPAAPAVDVVPAPADQAAVSPAQVATRVDEAVVAEKPVPADKVSPAAPPLDPVPAASVPTATATQLALVTPVEVLEVSAARTETAKPAAEPEQRTDTTLPGLTKSGAGPAMAVVDEPAAVDAAAVPPAASTKNTAPAHGNAQAAATDDIVIRDASPAAKVEDSAEPSDPAEPAVQAPAVAASTANAVDPVTPAPAEVPAEELTWRRGLVEALDRGEQQPTLGPDGVPRTPTSPASPAQAPSSANALASMLAKANAPTPAAPQLDTVPEAPPAAQPVEIALLEVTPVEPPVIDERRWRVVVASLAEPDAARVETERLNARGWEVQSREYRIGERHGYRIGFGEFATRDQAQVALDQFLIKHPDAAAWLAKY